MQKIKKLPASEIHKIAAGEVVERPANVVKELLENAIDAGATQITVYIEQAGQQLIRVVDNGSGMSVDDARICFDHHATSKIASFDDLSRCTTFGFRGEALTSIAAISKITLITKDTSSAVGTKIQKDSTDIDSFEEVSCQTGTDIWVQDLFYNVPARKKFLKAEQTEFRHISLLFQAFCFAYPAIHFTLYHDDRLTYTCPAANGISERIAQVWEPATHQNMIPVNYTHQNITFAGVIGSHQVYRYDRSSIIFFVNNRWVKNTGLAKAIIKGYLNVLPHDRFPAAIMNIAIDPQEIDINIHPRKEEVLFRQSRVVEQQLTQLVKTTHENRFMNIPKPIPPTSLVSFESFARPVIIQAHTVHQHPNFSEQKIIEQPTIPAIQVPITAAQITQDYRYIGTYSATYLLFEHTDQLVLIDQHAAHERVLYEQFKARFGNIPVIELLFAQKILLNKNDLQQIIPYLEIIAQHGLRLDVLHDQFLVRAVPVHLKECAFDELIKDIVACIVQSNQFEPENFLKILHETLHAQMACKAAVKAGDVLAESKIKQLIHDLLKIENRFVCPHGRPISWILHQSDIEKKFKRKL